MEKIVIINYGCFDEGTLNPNAACMLELARHLQESYEVHFFTNNNISNEILRRKIENISIHAFPVKKFMGRELFDIKSKCSKVYINNIFQNGLTAGIAVSFPFLSSVKILNQLYSYYPEMRKIIYEFDPLAYNGAIKNSFFLFVSKILTEAYAFKKADSIWLTRELFENYNTNVFKIFGNKFVNIGIPLIKEKSVLENEDIKLKNKRFNMVYVGTFYDSIRKPDYLIALMKQVTLLTGGQLNIYGTFVGEQSKKLIDDAKLEMGDRLVHHGKVSREEIPIILSQADLLINVSNSVSNQVPSKVFEYIETGKPILNISNVHNDASEHYLRRYPIAKLITESWQDNLLSDDARSVANFCCENKNKRVKINEIMEVYKDCTAKYIAELAKNAIISLD